MGRTYTERTMKEALRDYLKGREVRVIGTEGDNEFFFVSLEEYLTNERVSFWTRLPAVENPDFSEAILRAVRETQGEAL